MARGQTAGVMLGWPGISCGTDPTPVEGPAYTYPPSREVTEGIASLGCGSWAISPSQSPHESVPPQTVSGHGGSAHHWPGGHIPSLVKLSLGEVAGGSKTCTAPLPFSIMFSSESRK